jgi:hypothetical protein
MDNGQNAIIDCSNKIQTIKNLDITEDLYQQKLSDQLTNTKNSLLILVDTNTKLLFDKGFNYDNLTFSMSTNAGNKVQNLQVLLLKNQSFEKLLINDIDDDNIYVLTPENAQGYINSYALQYQIVMFSDVLEKQKIRTLTTIEEMKTYVDLRMLDFQKYIENLSFVKDK